jgi:heme/copper-type cytochrome/quinol oxidase subunit 2
VEGKVNIKMGIVWVCVVLFMAIQAMGVPPTTAAPMDQISGTFLLLCHCYFIFISLFFFFFYAVFVLFCSRYRYRDKNN